MQDNDLNDTFGHATSSSQAFKHRDQVVDKDKQHMSGHDIDETEFIVISKEPFSNKGTKPMSSSTSRLIDLLKHVGLTDSFKRATDDQTFVPLLSSHVNSVSEGKLDLILLSKSSPNELNSVGGKIVGPIRQTQTHGRRYLNKQTNNCNNQLLIDNESDIKRKVNHQDQEPSVEREAELSITPEREKSDRGLEQFRLDNISPYSEITNKQENNNNKSTISRTSDRSSYRTQSRSPTSTDSGIRAALNIGPCIVDMEINQLIEWKRKRTLMLLKSKEAPKASFDLTSPVSDSDKLSVKPADEVMNAFEGTPPPVQESMAPQSDSTCQSAESVALSFYDNVQTTKPMTQTNNLAYRNSLIENGGDNNNSLTINEEHKESSLSREMADKEQVQQKERCDDEIEQQDDKGVAGMDEYSDSMKITKTNSPGQAISTSEDDEETNANTLSLVSDLLGDLSHEDCSIVQKLRYG